MSTPVTGPDALYVVEALGAAGTERFHAVHENMTRACDEADVLAKTGAQVRVLVYRPHETIFKTERWER